MNELVSILWLALLPAAGNFLGGLLAEMSRPSPKAVSLALHAAVGLVLAVIATELLPEASEVLSGWWIGSAFIVGGLLYLVAASLANRLSGGNKGSTQMWLIYAAVMVDLASDGIVIGSSGAVAFGLALKLALGQVLADLPARRRFRRPRSGPATNGAQHDAA